MSPSTATDGVGRTRGRCVSSLSACSYIDPRRCQIAGFPDCACCQFALSAAKCRCSNFRRHRGSRGSQRQRRSSRAVAAASCCCLRQVGVTKKIYKKEAINEETAKRKKTMLAPPHFKLMAPCAAPALTACLSLSYLFRSHHKLCDTASAALVRSPLLTLSRCAALLLLRLRASLKVKPEIN